MAGMAIYDISQALHEKIAVWPGDQKFRLRWSMRIDRGDCCNASALTMSAHTGTHLDAPYHCEDSAADISRLPLDACVGRARVVAVPPEYASISAEFLRTLSWDGVERVLFRTRDIDGAEDRFDRNYRPIAQDGADFLAGRSLKLVGTDAASVDAFANRALSGHKRLLDGGIVILEGARLAHVPPGDYELICLPLKLTGLDGSPVRAILRTP
jgi:arylformamidase